MSLLVPSRLRNLSPLTTACTCVEARNKTFLDAHIRLVNSFPGPWTNYMRIAKFKENRLRTPISLTMRYSRPRSAFRWKLDVANLQSTKTKDPPNPNAASSSNPSGHSDSSTLSHPKSQILFSMYTKIRSPIHKAVKMCSRARTTTKTGRHQSVLNPSNIPDLPSWWQLAFTNERAD